MTKISYSGYRFPTEIIQQAIWLYVRFTLSFRERREPDVPGDLLRVIFGNVTEPFATLSRIARALACVGTRLSSPKVRYRLR
jgi:hypothetical protein